MKSYKTFILSAIAIVTVIWSCMPAKLVNVLIIDLIGVVLLIAADRLIDDRKD